MIRARRATALVGLLVVCAATGLSAQKTDKLFTRNGDTVTGEIILLDQGRLTLKTDAMSTLKVKWQRVLSVETDKIFEVVLSGHRIRIGSLSRVAPDSVRVVSAAGSLTVRTQDVVRLIRLKDNFWDALDGEIDAGFGYTQQNSRYDVNANLELEYARRGSPSRWSRTNVTRLDTEVAFTTQTGVDDQVRLGGTLAHLREFGRGWFFLGYLEGDRNSQLSLDYRVTLGGGAGRLLHESTRAGLGVWIGPGFALEQFADEDANTSFPLEIAALFGIYNWTPVDTDLSGQLGVVPLLGEGGRWRLSLSLDAKQEIVSDLYLVLGLRDSYDSRPGSEGANKNDLSLNLGLGWSF